MTGRQTWEVAAAPQHVDTPQSLGVLSIHKQYPPPGTPLLIAGEP